MPGWREYPVARHLGSRFGAPVWMDNEVHLMTLGEFHAGRGVGTSDLLFVKIGTGISAGLCSNGRVHRGAHGFAGDIGHVAVADDASVLCRCGNTGCLEALAGGSAIAREAHEAATSGRSPYLAEVLAGGRQISATHVGMAANRGDPFSIELLSRSGRLVGETLATLVNAYNPSMVVVGGGVAQAGEILISAMREALYRRSRSLTTQSLQIVRAEMGRTAGLVGAALAVADELFAPEYLRSWIDQGSPGHHPEAAGGTTTRRGQRELGPAGAPHSCTSGGERRPEGRKGWRMTRDAAFDRVVVESLGPHGESAASVDQLAVQDADAARARSAAFSVAVVIHTTGSDWSRQQIAGISDTLDRFGATLIEVIDCGFRARNQVDALERLVALRPDAVISLPVDNLRTAEAHRAVTAAGIKLVLMDNAPIGLIAGKHYVSVISADNFGNGQVAAAILAPRIPERGTVGIVGFGVDFFATNEREIGFRKWMREHRPDATLRLAEFLDLETAGDVVLDFIAQDLPIDALFVPWDEPAIRVIHALRSIGRDIPLTTVDLGNEVALEIAAGGMVAGVGAQMPYDLGVAEATATIMALVGAETPPWVAIPALSVTRDNVLDAYEAVWHQPAPADLRSACEATDRPGRS